MATHIESKEVLKMRLWRASLAILLIMILASAAATAGSSTPLAIVDGDTISSADLEQEIAIMKKMKDFEGEVVLPSAEDALHRLIQNRLIIQEGYRLGFDRKFTVANQVRETVRLKLVAALLDSIAATVPTSTPDLMSERRKAVDLYIDGLINHYHVEVDSTLLASLEYGSDDPQVKKRLRESEEVLAVLPSGSLSIRSLSMVIRFTEFHGLTGKPDADESRDRIFKEWLVEGLLSYEAKLHKLEQAPHIRRMARNLEENRVSEETLKSLLKFDFNPGEEEIEGFYRENLSAVTPSPRVKMQSVLLTNQKAAETFRGRLQVGAKLAWLKKVTKEVADGPPPFPADWFSPEKLGLRPEEVFVGSVPEPYEVPGNAWAVAIVDEIEQPVPLPLAECRGTMIQLMRQKATHDLMRENFRKLEEAADVLILPGAEELVEELLRGSQTTE
ncbi:MAG: peptidyl-prolyl cis-trans isomerase [Gemmatimonadales bacterium]|nr:peptidyl-prolyl cis-trans isomerase [Gemmatimonadales bacterium]